jgi:anti-anti-sigma factor
LRQPQESGAIIFPIGGVIDRAAIPAWCARLRVVLGRKAGEVVICDVAELARADAVAVDLLSRLQLTARRDGRRLRLRHASAALADLLALCGLAEVLPLEPPSALPPEGQAEEREQPGRVEEEADPGDLPA